MSLTQRVRSCLCTSLCISCDHSQFLTKHGWCVTKAENYNLSNSTVMSVFGQKNNTCLMETLWFKVNISDFKTASVPNQLNKILKFVGWWIILLIQEKGNSWMRYLYYIYYIFAEIIVVAIHYITWMWITGVAQTINIHSELVSCQRYLCKSHIANKISVRLAKC